MRIGEKQTAFLFVERGNRKGYGIRGCPTGGGLNLLKAGYLDIAEPIVGPALAITFLTFAPSEIVFDRERYRYLCTTCISRVFFAIIQEGKGVKGSWISEVFFLNISFNYRSMIRLMVRRCEIVELEIKKSTVSCSKMEYVGKIMGMVLWEKNKSKARNKIFSRLFVFERNKRGNIFDKIRIRIY